MKEFALAALEARDPFPQLFCVSAVNVPQSVLESSYPNAPEYEAVVQHGVDKILDKALTEFTSDDFAAKLAHQ
ncbi:MAG: hypothetical protein ACXWKG_07955 [Limisphaerales bacterium]